MNKSSNASAPAIGTQTKRPPCITVPDLAFPVTVEQNALGKFRVTYGQQVKAGLSYADAAREFGLCVFHALACVGKLDNSSAL